MVTGGISKTLPFPSRTGLGTKFDLRFHSPTCSRCCFLILDSKNFPLPQGEGQGEGTSHESQSHSFSLRRLSSDFLSSRLCAAADESSADRIPCCCPQVVPPRGIPAGSTRAWVCGTEKHCH